MDGSIKERLTGALIFVAVVVIVVPEMYSGPGYRRAVVEMPADPADSVAPVRTYSMPVDGGAGSVAATTVSAPVPEPVVQPEEVATEAAPEPASLPSSAGAPAASEPVEPPPESRLPAPAPAASLREQAEPAAKWWTQVGIFSSRENADRLARQLRTGGFSAEISPYTSGGKDMFRVRVGPVQDRAEAQALLARLKTAGHAALLVAP